MVIHIGKVYLFATILMVHHSEGSRSCYEDSDCERNEICHQLECVPNNMNQPPVNISTFKCPNTEIDASNEPKCKKKIDCKQSNSICYKGSCCPKVKKDALPVEPYQLNLTCQPSQLPVFAHRFSFCDPETKKIWLFGMNDKNGNPSTTRFKPCDHNDNCTDDSICLMEESYRYRCYENPIKEISFGFVLIRAFFTFSLPIAALSGVIFATIKFT